MQCYLRRLNILFFSLVPVICPLCIPRSDLSCHEIIIVLLQKKRYFVGDKAKGRISKRVFQENKVRQIFRKTNISYQGVRNAPFLENLPCFAFLLPPICSLLIISNQSNEHQRHFEYLEYLIRIFS